MNKSEGILYNVTKAAALGKFDVPLQVNDSEASGNVQNLTTFCQANYVPSVEEYFTAFNEVGVALFTLGGLGVTLTVLLFADTLRHIIKNAPRAVKGHSAFVLSVYPVVAIATYCAIIVPRAQLLAEAVTQGMFMACLYQLFCLFMAYCGGEEEVITSLTPKCLNMRVPPCCCYPCCKLPHLPVNKKTIMFLRLLVLQLPVVQGLLYMVLLVMWADEESLYNINYMYFQPIVIASILFGVWGIIMTMKMLSENLKDFHMQGKFVVLQLVLVFAKLQGIIARTVVWTGGIKCEPPITASVYTNLVYNSVMLTELVILGFFARLLYIRDLPEIPTHTPDLQSQICVIGDSHYTKNSGEKQGVINPSFVKCTCA